MAKVTIEELKQLLVENCVLKASPDLITEHTLLFGPGSIGLDSLDALQMTVSIEQQYGIAISDADTARRVLQTLGTLGDWLAEQPVTSRDRAQ